MIKKIYPRKYAVKDFKKHFPNATKEEFTAFVTGYNMGFEFMNKKYKRIKKENKAIIETMEILSDKRIVKGLKSALEDFRKGRYTILLKDKNATRK